MILLSLYALILTEALHRALAAMLCSLVSHLFLAMLGKMPSMKGIISWMDEGVLGLLFGMMVMVYIISTTGIFQYLAVKMVALAAKKRRADTYEEMERDLLTEANGSELGKTMYNEFCEVSKRHWGEDMRTKTIFAQDVGTVVRDYYIFIGVEKLDDEVQELLAARGWGPSRAQSAQYKRVLEDLSRYGIR